MKRLCSFVLCIVLILSLALFPAAAVDSGEFVYDFYNFANYGIACYRDNLLRSDGMGLVSQSTDGVHWSNTALPIEEYGSPLELFSTRQGFALIESGKPGQNYTYTSADGLSFVRRENNLPAAQPRTPMIQTSAGILFLGDSLLFSADGVNFLTIVENASSIYSIQAVGDRFFYFSDSGVYSSEDGVTFQRVALTGDRAFYYDGKFHLIATRYSYFTVTYTHFVSSGIRNFVSTTAYDSEFAMSADLITTINGQDYAYKSGNRYRFVDGSFRDEGSAISGYSANFSAILGGISASSSGGLFFSTDGVNFRSMGDWTSLRTTLFYQNGYFYFEKDDGLAFRSTDGHFWERVSKMPPRTFTSAVASGKTLALSNGKYSLTENRKIYPIAYENFEGEWRISTAGSGFLLEKQGTVPEFFYSPDGISRFSLKDSVTTAPHFAFSSHLTTDGNLAVLCNASGLIYHTSFSELFSPKATPRVRVNGAYLSFAQNPVIEDGSTLVPLRFLAENIGYTVGWDAENARAVLTLGDTSCSIAINSSTAFVNGAAKEMPIPARLIEGKTFIPLRFISEAMGASVVWDANNAVAIITTE